MSDDPFVLDAAEDGNLDLDAVGHIWPDDADFVETLDEDFDLGVAAA
jgi:hypothetical protein